MIESSCIIVLGCFRSGTSAVAGTLHNLGVFMGDLFDSPNQNNPKGFFEDLEFKKIHNWMEDSSNIDTLLTRSADDFYKELIAQREHDHYIWGVKDPLLCKYLGKLTTFLKADHKLIVCRRPVEEIAASMTKSIGLGMNSDPMMFKPLAQHYIDHMEKSLVGYGGPVLEIQKTDSMLQILEPISNFVGLPITDAAREFLS
jgi:hypothetical protein